MNEITLVGCTKNKRKGKHKARNLYDESPLFRHRKQWAENKGDWFILSAKFGLISPEAEIETYDVHIKEINPEPWAKGVMDRLSPHLDSLERVYILAGHAYVEPLTPLLERHGIDVIDVNAGLMPGERMQKLKAANRENSNEQLSEYA